MGVRSFLERQRVGRALAIVPDDLHEVAALAPEHEQMPALRNDLGIVRLNGRFEPGLRHDRCDLAQEHVTLRALLFGHIIKRRNAWFDGCSDVP